MSKEQQKRLLLAVLFLLLAGLAWRQLGTGGAGGAGGRRGLAASRSRTGSGAGDLGPQVEAVELRLADLERSGAHYSPGRDPFRFGEPPRPEPPPPVVEPVAAVREVTTRPPEPPPLPPAGPQPPPVDLVYLGSFGPRGHSLAVFSDGNDIFNAQRGDVLKGKFIVVEIGYESADLEFVGFPDVPAKRLAAGG